MYVRMYVCMVVIYMCLTQYCCYFSFSLSKTFVEAIYLNDDETLNQQTNEKHHIFHWLRLQARQGVAEAEVPRNTSGGQMRRHMKSIEKKWNLCLKNPYILQQALARMLFWGQQGVTQNIWKAVRHYERGAVQLEDPASMYDYGIVLLQVHTHVASLEWFSFPAARSCSLIHLSAGTRS